MIKSWFPNVWSWYTVLVHDSPSVIAATSNTLVDNLQVGLTIKMPLSFYFIFLIKILYVTKTTKFDFPTLQSAQSHSPSSYSKQYQAPVSVLFIEFSARVLLYICVHVDVLLLLLFPGYE